MKLKVIISLLIVTIMFISVFNICNCTEKSCNGCNKCRDCIGIGEKIECPNIDDDTGPTGLWAQIDERGNIQPNTHKKKKISKLQSVPASSGNGFKVYYADHDYTPEDIATPDGGIVTDIMLVDGKINPSKSVLNLSYKGYDRQKWGINNLVIMHYDSKKKKWNILPTTNDRKKKILKAKISSTGLYTIGSKIVNDKEPPKIAWVSPSKDAQLKGLVKLVCDVSDNVGVDKVEYRLSGLDKWKNDFKVPSWAGDSNKNSEDEYVSIGVDETIMDGEWSIECDFSDYATGEYRLEAIANDLCGNKSTAYLDIMISGTKEPTVEFRGISYDNENQDLIVVAAFSGIKNGAENNAYFTIDGVLRGYTDYCQPLERSVRISPEGFGAGPHKLTIKLEAEQRNSASVTEEVRLPLSGLFVDKENKLYVGDEKFMYALPVGGNNADDIKVNYSADGGKTWHSLQRDESGEYGFVWKAPKSKKYPAYYTFKFSATENDRTVYSDSKVEVNLYDESELD